MKETKSNKISINFRCGHFESWTEKEIKKQEIFICYPFMVNGKKRAESGQYCLECSKKLFSNFSIK